MEEPTRKRLIYGLLIAAAVFLIFLAGYLPASWRARGTAEELKISNAQLAEAQAQLAQTRYDLEVARLRGRLGEVLQEANANNYGNAAAQASAFYDGLREAIASPQLPSASERRTVLEALQARRDEISADLARADAGVKAKLAEMYIQFGAAVP